MHIQCLNRLNGGDDTSQNRKNTIKKKKKNRTIQYWPSYHATITIIETNNKRKSKNGKRKRKNARKFIIFPKNPFGTSERIFKQAIQMIQKIISFESHHRSTVAFW